MCLPPELQRLNNPNQNVASYDYPLRTPDCQNSYPLNVDHVEPNKRNMCHDIDNDGKLWYCAYGICIDKKCEEFYPYCSPQNRTFCN